MKALALTPLEHAKKMLLDFFEVKQIVKFERERKVLVSQWESLGESG